MMLIGHISDLHLGRTAYGHDLYEDQAFFLKEIVRMVKDNGLNAVVIAGDVFDKYHPSNDAIGLLDDFLVELSSVCEVFMIPGNHDSSDFLGYHKRFMQKCNVHTVGKYEGIAEEFEKKDEYGTIHFYLLPYMTQRYAQDVYGSDAVKTREDSFTKTFENSHIDSNSRNVLVCHQNVLYNDSTPEESGSETTIGTDEGVAYSVFKDFDYVALGHIHKSQKRGRDTIRYCGTPMIYDKTEIGTTKCMTVIDMKEKGDITVTEIPINPLHEWKLIRGDIDELIDKIKVIPDDVYVYAELTSPAEHAHARLKDKHELCLFTDRVYTVEGTESFKQYSPEDLSKIPASDLFAELYRIIKGTDISEEDMEEIKDVIRTVDERRQGQ